MLHLFFLRSARSLIAAFAMLSLLIQPVFAFPTAAATILDDNTPGASSETSLNWAGYIARGASYTYVSGTWVIPSVQLNGTNADATWVGIGGNVSQDLIQAGTEAVPDTVGGTDYRAWYETLPGIAHELPVTVRPGNSVTVSLSKGSGDTWYLFFTNNTTGQQYATSILYHSSLSSADWIEEMPLGVTTTLGLDNFGSIHFTGGYTIADGVGTSIAGSGAHPLTMTNRAGATIASVGELDADGGGFVVTRQEGLASALSYSAYGMGAVAAAIAPAPAPSIQILQSTGRTLKVYVQHLRHGRYRLRYYYAS